MKLVQYRESFCAFDGKIILRINIDFPDDVCDPASVYVKEFSDCCLSFAKDILFEHISKEYNSSFSTGNRFDPYFYRMSVTENVKGKILDYTFDAALIKSGRSISARKKNVRFRDNYIIFHKRKEDPAL
jgi:hypothetical protein